MFVVSKIAWLLLAPSNLIGILLLLGVLLALLRWRRSGTMLIGGAALLYLVCGFSTLGQVLLQPLEASFPRPTPAPTAVTGIVVLGGGTDGAIGSARLGYELNDAGDRMVEGLRLLRSYPEARLVFTGGFGSLSRRGTSEAEQARTFFSAFGVSESRLAFDPLARNTAENAMNAKALAMPKPGETWLLVTSAFHMPRAMASFRAAGFDVVAWPVDYRTTGDVQLLPSLDGAAANLSATETALHEWLGLLAYWLTGRTDRHFPAEEHPG